MHLILQIHHRVHRQCGLKEHLALQRIHPGHAAEMGATTAHRNEEIGPAPCGRGISSQGLDTAICRFVFGNRRLKQLKELGLQALQLELTVCLTRAESRCSAEATKDEQACARTVKVHRPVCSTTKVPVQRHAWATEEMQQVNWAYKYICRQVTSGTNMGPT